MMCVEGVRDLLSSVNIDLSSYTTELGRHLAGTHSPLSLLFTTCLTCRSVSVLTVVSRRQIRRNTPVSASGSVEYWAGSVSRMMASPFLTNVSSCSRSLFAVARPSVHLSVTLVHPTQVVQTLGNISTTFGTVAIH